MDEYDCIKKSSLKFKGEKKKRRKRYDGARQGTSEDNQPRSDELDELREDAEAHGGWWKVDNLDQIKEDVAIEFLPGCYARANSNGAIVLGNPHPPGEEPDEEEIFTAMCPSTNQITFKSGFGRYLGIDNRRRLMGLSEAIGEPEIFIPIFEDGKLALSAHNECFLAPESETDNPQIVAKSTKAGPYEMINIRINVDPEIFSKKREASDGFQNVKIHDSELGYLKNNQPKAIDVKISKEDKKLLKKARVEGKVHETLLDKRVKQKSDKYCK